MNSFLSPCANVISDEILLNCPFENIQLVDLKDSGNLLYRRVNNWYDIL